MDYLDMQCEDYKVKCLIKPFLKHIFLVYYDI